MVLYHTGFEVIRRPDIYRGRKNADFGQGFYLTPEEDFAHRWAKVRKGQDTIVNVYELDETGLAICRFDRDQAWFDYIYGNRNHQPDTLLADVVMGPIANDTIYDTLGITTSGVLDAADARELLMIGPAYRQVAIKTERALAGLTWQSSEVMDTESLDAFRKTVAAEEEAFQQLFAEEFERISERK